MTVMRFVFGVLGVITTLNGFNIIENPIWCSAKRDFCADFTGYNVPFGTFLIVVGLFIILASAFGKRNSGNDILMCAKCNQPHERKDVSNHKCPQCHEELEPLEGFYERHPELKDK